MTEARETANTQQTWKQSFSYDRYGNRIGYENFVGTNLQTLDNKIHPSINPQTNRFNTNQGYSYDFNGNLVEDAEGRSFTFNGDNKQTDIKNGNINVGRYFYDGEGKRVKKVTNSEETVFVYDGLGKLIAEYSTEISQTPQTKYLTEDHLGTPRIITDASGQITARRDFLPFGEDLPAGVGTRNSAQKYGATTDDIRQKFTGYQKDKETSLDFAEARMYENRFGRFTAIDPMLASGKSANPQTFNRYVYVGNNPIGRIDPFGTDWYFLNGKYRWSTDNMNLDRTFDELLADPVSVEGWTKVSMNKSGEFNYFTRGRTPGTSQEIVLSNTKTFDLIGSHWDYTGNVIISDQKEYDAFMAQQKVITDGIAAMNEYREMNDALRPLTDTKTGTMPQSPGNQSLVFDRMIRAEDGQPQIGTTGRFLSGRESDFESGTGKSVSPIPAVIPSHKKDQLFCFSCNRPGARIAMEDGDSNHMFMQPQYKRIEDMTLQEYTEFIIGTRSFWKPVNNPNQLK